MSKPLPSKHRSGGPHSGGQPQSNQRQSMPDYQRTEGRSYSHTNRPNNQPGTHIQSNQIQMNIHPQIAMQAQLRNYAAANHTTQAGTQPLVAQQAIPVGHANATQQPPILTPHNMNPNPNRSNTNFPGFIPNQNRMQSMRPAFPPRAGAQQGIQQPMYGYFQQPMYPYPHPQIQPQQLIQNVNTFQPYIMDMNQFSLQRYPNSTPVNMQNNMPINQSNEIPPAQAQQTFQPQPKELPKRSRQPAIVYDLDGNKIDLESIRQKKKANPTDATEVSATESKNPESEKVENEVTESVNVISANGDEKEIELDQSPEVMPDADNSDLSEPAKIEEENYEPVSQQENIQNEPAVEENVVDVVNISQCDNDVQEENLTPSPVSSPTSGDDLCSKDEINKAVDIIVEKADEINLNEPEVAVVSESQIPAFQQEINAPLCDNSKSLCETTNSVDMEVGSVKVADDNQNGTPNEPSSDATNDYLSGASMEEKDELENRLDDNSSPNAAELSNDDNKDVESDSKLTNSLNKNETKVYEKDFLISLRDRATKNALSNSNQENIKDIIRKNNKTSTHDMFIPNFANRSSQMDSFRNKSQQQAVRRPSQPSKNYSDSKSKKISSTSLQYELYQPTENAWRPGKASTDDPIEVETESLLKNVRAILNKLTPQNYGILLEQFKNLKIDSEIRLTKVIDLIFEKAVKEPAFVVQYAGFCSQLVHIKVVNSDSVEVKFKNLLIKKCEETFFKELYSDIPSYNDRVKEIDECDDPVKKKELDDFLDDDKRFSRKRAVGNIKLIAELFKLKLLNTKIMIACFKNLLGHNHEESIECLCALITNIGKNFSAEIMKSKQSHDNMALFNNVFSELKKIHDQNQWSSRIRFMILDLLDLRQNNWVPRRKLDGPKTIAQVHEDMDKEARLKSLEMSELSRKKKSYHNSDEWQEVKSRKSHTNPPPANKMSLSISMLKESLVSSTSMIGSGPSPFNMFQHGSHGGSNSNSQSRSSSSTFENKYQVLSNDKNQQRSNSTLHDSLNAKDHLNRRDARKTSDVTNYYQQSDNRDNSLPNSRNSSVRSDIYEAKLEINIDPATFNAKLSDCVNGYLKNNLTYEETIEKMLLFCSKKNFHKFISQSLEITVDLASQLRAMWGEFLGDLFVAPYYDCSEIFEGFKMLFLMSSDLIIDIPKFWTYVAEIIAHTVLTAYKSSSSKKKEVLKCLSKAFREVTGNDCAKLTDGITQIITQELDEKAAQDVLSQVSINAKNECGELSDTIDEFANNQINFDAFVKLIETTNRDKTDNKKFESALYRKILSILINSNDGSKYNFVNQKKVQQILHRYCNTPEDQILLLHESATRAQELNFPPNFLQELFSQFFDLNIVEKQSFFDWEEKKVGPSMAFITTNRFMENLRNNAK